MQLVSQNFSLDDDVARLPGSRGAVYQPGQALRRLLAQYERIVPQEALSQPSFVVAQQLDNPVTPSVRFDTANDLFMPNSTRPLFCSSTHAPGHSHCMHHCMHHC
jgi:hypothetical protein